MSDTALFNITGMKACPYFGCDGVIDTFKQSHFTGGGIFVCPACDRRAFARNDGQLSTQEDYGRDLDKMCETG